MKWTCHCCKVNGAEDFCWSWPEFVNSLSSSFSQPMWCFSWQRGLRRCLEMQSCSDAHVHVKAAVFALQVIEMHERIKEHFVVYRCICYTRLSAVTNKCASGENRNSNYATPLEVLSLFKTPELPPECSQLLWLLLQCHIGAEKSSRAPSEKLWIQPLVSFSQPIK